MVLDLFLTLIFDLLHRNFLFELLDLIKTPNEIFLEVSFDVVCYHFHAVVNMIVLACIELLLDEVCRFLVIVLAVLCITWTLSFGKWPIEFCLESEQLGRLRTSCMRNIFGFFFS